MGVYDFVLVEPRVNLPNFDLEDDQHRVSWQTRTFRDPMYRLHLITEDGHLYRAKHNYEPNGFAESHGETGSFDHREMIDEEWYSGYPREEFDLDWYRVRFIGDMRITAQTGAGKMYDVSFDRNDISDIFEVGNPFETDISRLDEGTKVYDREDTYYVVVEVTNEIASEHIAKEEVVDRDHTIYEEKTVADLNPEYPDDDTVVIVRPSNGDREIPVPVSRLALEAHSALG